MTIEQQLESLNNSLGQIATQLGLIHSLMQSQQPSLGSSLGSSLGLSQTQQIPQQPPLPQPAPQPAPPPVQQPTPPPVQQPAQGQITLQDINAALNEVVAKLGGNADPVVDMLRNRFGAVNLRQVSPDQYHEVIQAAQELAS